MALDRLHPTYACVWHVSGGNPTQSCRVAVFCSRLRVSASVAARRGVFCSVGVSLLHLEGVSAQEILRVAAIGPMRFHAAAVCGFAISSASNQTLERTADRQQNYDNMTTDHRLQASLALVSGRSAFSR